MVRTIILGDNKELEIKNCLICPCSAHDGSRRICQLLEHFEESNVILNRHETLNNCKLKIKENNNECI